MARIGTAVVRGDEERDTNLGMNLLVYHTFLEWDGDRVDEYLSHLDAEDQHLAQRLFARFRSRREPSHWVPHATFLRFETAMVEMLGHPGRLREVGRSGVHIGYGFQSVKAGFTRHTGWLVTSPWLGFREVRALTRSYVTNKTACVHRLGTTAQAWQLIEHRRELVSTLDDRWSILFYIPGFAESVPTLWRQPEIRCPMQVVCIDPVDALRAEGVETVERTPDGGLWVGGRQVGRRVHAVPDRAMQFVGRWSELPTPDSIPATLVTESVTTPCRRTGDAHVFMAAGQLWEDAGHRLPRSAFQLTWREPGLNQKVRRWFRGLRGSRKETEVAAEFATGMSQRAELVDRDRAAAEAEAALDARRRYLARTTPTAVIAEALARGRFDARQMDGVVLQFDFVGYTRRTAGWTPAEVARIAGGLLNQAMTAARLEGGWDYKSMGDGGICVFAPGWERGAEEPEPFPSPRDAARAALRAADRMHADARSLGWELRIGVHWGPVVWHDPSRTTVRVDPAVTSSERLVPVARGAFDTAEVLTASRLEGNGTGLNTAARLESYAAKPGETAASSEFVAVLSGAGVRDPSPGDEQSGFCFLGAVPIKHGTRLPAWRWQGGAPG